MRGKISTWSLHSKLLPVKLHYLLFFGGQGAVLPFLPVIAKHLGLSATALGLFYSFIPFPSFIAVPFICAIADRFHATRKVLLLSITLHALAYVGIACLEPIPPVQQIYVCAKEPAGNNDTLPCTSFDHTLCHVSAPNVTMEPLDFIQHCQFHNRSHEIVRVDSNVFLKVQSWLFLLLMILVWVTSGVTCSLADALCYQSLTDGQSYGQQRLWGTVGWGFVACISGYFMADEQTADYSISLWVMGILMATDLLNVAVMPITVLSQRPRMITRQILVVLRRPCVTLFILAVGVLGLLTGLLWTYSFWFYQDMGADHTMMGLTVAVECFLGEMPFLFFSEKIINRLGHFGSVAVSYLAYGVRYLIFSQVGNVWLLLPTAVLYGPGYSLFYASMTSFATEVAPPGLDGSIQGLMTGTFEDLGAALGGVLGGLMMDSFGGRMTFLSSGVLAIASCIVCTIISRYFFLSNDLQKTATIPQKTVVKNTVV